MRTAPSDAANSLVFEPIEITSEEGVDLAGTSLTYFTGTLDPNVVTDYYGQIPDSNVHFAAIVVATSDGDSDTALAYITDTLRFTGDNPTAETVRETGEDSADINLPPAVQNGQIRLQGVQPRQQGTQPPPPANGGNGQQPPPTRVAGQNAPPPTPEGQTDNRPPPSSGSGNQQPPNQ